MILSARRPIALLVAVVVFASACSGSVEFSFGGQSASEAAVDLIEGDEMAESLMLDAITGAVCDEPASDADGTIFLCTAQSQGEVIDFEVTLEPEERIFAAPTNVVAAKFLDGYATAAAQALNDQNSIALPDDAIDCGAKSIVLDANRQMTCELTNPDGTVLGALLTVQDVADGTFGIEVVEAP